MIESKQSRIEQLKEMIFKMKRTEQLLWSLSVFLWGAWLGYILHSTQSKPSEPDPLRTELDSLRAELDTIRFKHDAIRNELIRCEGREVGREMARNLAKNRKVK